MHDAKDNKEKRTTYEWEPELQGLGCFKSGRSADSLKGQSKKKRQNKCNMQLSTFTIEKKKKHLIIPSRV